jgi:sodium transport system ATP-binding protein
MIEIANLRKTYKDVVAVSSVSFTARDGLVTGLLGPNGAGKTTVLRAITGLLRPDSGEARVDGLHVEVDPMGARARLGAVPEVVGLYDHLTVREHLLYAGELHGVSSDLLGERTAGLLDRFTLLPLSERRASTLSQGQRRRVALARALVHSPSNVVLDEPTNGLDVLSAREVRRGVRRLADSGCAVLFSSHVMPEVSAVCDQIVVLSRGAVIAAGTPSEILARAGAASLEDAFVKLIGSEEGVN